MVIIPNGKKKQNSVYRNCLVAIVSTLTNTFSNNAVYGNIFDMGDFHGQLIKVSKYIFRNVPNSIW